MHFRPGTKMYDCKCTICGKVFQSPSKRRVQCSPCIAAWVFNRWDKVLRRLED